MTMYIHLYKIWLCVFTPKSLFASQLLVIDDVSNQCSVNYRLLGRYTKSTNPKIIAWSLADTKHPQKKKFIYSFGIFIFV